MGVRRRLAICTMLLSVLLVVSAAAAVGRVEERRISHASEIVNSVADSKCIILAVDNSGSISQAELTEENLLLSAMLTQLDLMNYRGQVGLISFTCDVVRIMDPLPYFPGSTRTIIEPLAAGIRRTSELTATPLVMPFACNLIRTIPGPEHGALLLVTDGLPTAIDCNSGRQEALAQQRTREMIEWFRRSCSQVAVGLVSVILDPDSDEAQEAYEFWDSVPGVVLPAPEPSVAPAPSIPDPVAWTATLTWGASPSDLDLHLWTPSGEHVYFGNPSASGVRLSSDDTTGYGPETLTFTTSECGRYALAVHHYQGESASFAGSGAEVALTRSDMDGSILFYQPACGGGLDDLWLLCCIDVGPNGAEFVPVDSCRSNFDAGSPQSPCPASHLNIIDDFDPPIEGVFH